MTEHMKEIDVAAWMASRRVGQSDSGGAGFILLPMKRLTLKPGGTRPEFVSREHEGAFGLTGASESILLDLATTVAEHYYEVVPEVQAP